MKVLITGGSGYIGSHTAIQLLKYPKNEVISIDNFMNSKPEALERISEIAGRGVINYNVDIRDFEALKEVFNGIGQIDGIIHFAALKAVGESVEKPLLYYDINVSGLVNMLEICKQFNVPNFIFSSSCSVYGNSSTLPVNELTPLGKAESPYANSKRIGEEIIQDFTKANPTKCIALRYFNPVGAHLSGKNGEYPINKPNNLVPVIAQTAIGKIDKMYVHGSDYPTRDGSCVRDYVHVLDIADAHVLALQKLMDKSINDPYSLFNLGTGQGVSVFEAIDMFEKVNNIKLNYEKGPRREGDVAAIYSDCSKAKNILGWEPKLNLEDMMSSAWKWEQHLKQQA